ncbi:Rad2 nuclease [Dinochytrium kinnereticum]|nr:Rad2 nuclease [Dinochytrium kinnereticum]
MAHELIKALQKENIKYVVAPYEADAQLAYMEKMKKVSAVLTEDSDLLVFGCQKVIVKLDMNGSAVEINAADFGKIPAFKRGWSLREFRHACILSGCDYLPSLKGVGLKKAFAAVSEYRTGERVIKNWKKWGKVINAPKVHDSYEEEFRKADMTFLHQRVFDVDLGELVHLNPLSDGLDPSLPYDFLGPDIDPSIAKLVATGVVDPVWKIDFSSSDYSKKVDDASAAKIANSLLQGSL